ncbi:MAG: hypothetical protein V4627_10825 [Pseudomonadota bacterium]
MTTQATDSATFRGKKYLVCGVDGPELVVPTEFGLKPEMPSTACYRGWMAEYSIDKSLTLSDLYVFHDAGLPVKNRTPNGPKINGVEPQEPNSYLGFNCLYKNLNVPLTFTGGMLLSNGFIRELGANMGFHPFWKFEELHELTFEHGSLISAADKSVVAKTVREQYLVKGFLGRPDVSDEKAVREWIERSFSLHYHF